MKKSERKVVLYNPAPGEASPKTGILPLGLLSMVGQLDKEGYLIVIVNYNDENKREKLLKAAENAVCVGFSAMTGYQITDALKIAAFLREHYPTLKFVWGGPHPSLLPDQTLHNEYVDIVVTGLDQGIFYNLILALENHQSLQSIDGISYKANGKIIHNKPAQLQDLNKFPPIPFHLVNLHDYITATEYGKRTISYYTSVGCPYKCGFCAITKQSNRLWKALRPERVLADITFLKEKYNIDSIKIVDGDFFIDFIRAKEILRGIKKIGIKASYMSIRADQAVKMDDELWQLCSETINGMVIGLESCKQEDLDLMDKGTTVEQNLESVKLARKYNVDLILPLIVGLPKDGKKERLREEFNYMIDYVVQLYDIHPTCRFYIFMYTPYPGTPLYDRAKALGFKEPQSLEQWATFSLWETNLPWADPAVSKLVDQALYYYMAVLNRVVYERIKRMAFPLNPLLFSLEMILKRMVLFRMRHKFFGCPVEANIMKKVTHLLAANEEK